MVKQTVSLGAAPNDGTGDTLRIGGDKINDNFDELYAQNRYTSIGFLNDIIAGFTVPVNSVTYVLPICFNLWLDRTVFPATHYRIVGRGASSEASQAITGQLQAGGVAIHTGGDDFSIPSNTNTDIDTGWLTVDVAASGLWSANIALKGGNATADFVAVKPMQILFKVVN